MCTGTAKSSLVLPSEIAEAQGREVFGSSRDTSGIECMELCLLWCLLRGRCRVNFIGEAEEPGEQDSDLWSTPGREQRDLVGDGGAVIETLEALPSCLNIDMGGARLLLRSHESALKLTDFVLCDAGVEGSLCSGGWLESPCCLFVNRLGIRATRLELSALTSRVATLLGGKFPVVF